MKRRNRRLAAVSARIFAVRNIFAGCRVLLSLAGSTCAAVAAMAQSTNYSTAEVAAGGAVRLGYYGAVQKGCAPEPLPTIDVASAPKHGIVTVRAASLTTNKIASCPHLKLPVQVVFYRAQPGFVGDDQVVFGVKRINGKIDIWSISIKVKQKPSSPPLPSKSL